MDRQTILQVSRMATGGLSPHFTFLLDCPAALAQSRLQGRKGAHPTKDRWDHQGVAFYEALRQGYEDLAKENPDRFILLSGQQDTQTLVKESIAQLCQRLGL